MKRLLIVAALVAAVAVLVGVRMRARGKVAPAPDIEEVQAAEGIPVDVATAREGCLRITRSLSGEVRGSRQTNLTAVLDHKVEAVLVSEGDTVRRGQVLVRFDTRTSPDIVARLTQAGEAHAAADRLVKRLEPLVARGAISESEMDDARTALSVAEANLRDAHLLVELVSPIGGIVTWIAVNPGDAVESGDNVAQVAALDSVRVVADVASDLARELRPGARVTLGGAAEPPPATVAEGVPSPSTPVEGRVARVSIGTDPVSRLHEVEAMIANPGLTLRPGQLVSLLVVTGEVGPAVLAPRAALLTEMDVVAGGEYPAYVIEGDRAVLRTLRAGAVSEDEAEIVAGLRAGEQVVVFGANRLTDGARVKLHAVDARPAAEVRS